MVSLKVLVMSFLILTSFMPAFASSTATVHGAVYEWYSFELLDDAVVEVNSTPPQTIVAKYGIYSFDLAEGTYKINAYYYQENSLESSTEETIIIDSDGDYIVDLLLHPVYENPFEEVGDENITTSIEEGTELLEDGDEVSVYLYAFPIFLILVILAIFVVRKKGKNIDTGTNEVEEESLIVNIAPEEELKEKNVSNDEVKEDTLPEDLREVIEIIESNGGRITQKELRQKVDYSEAKVSLMVADLENRGLIQKFKKGRGNVIVLSQK